MESIGQSGFAARSADILFNASIQRHWEMILIPQGWMTIAQCSSWGLSIGGAFVPEGRLKPCGRSAVPSGLRQLRARIPKAEELGYSRTSLRDKEPLRSGDGFRSLNPGAIGQECPCFAPAF